jgi:predicted ester cyclase
MSLQDNKALARRGIEAFASGNTEAVGEIYAADYVNYQHHHPDSPEVIRVVAAWKAFVAEFHQAFPDFHDTIEDQIAEADKGRDPRHIAGTHRGMFLNIAPTGSWAPCQCPGKNSLLTCGSAYICWSQRYSRRIFVRAAPRVTANV